MVTVVPASEFNARDDLPDWRYLVDTIEATFHAPDFESGVELIAAIAHAAEDAAHHPDLQLRYPGSVRVALTTHDAGAAITDEDLSLARRISALAVERGARSEPTSASVIEVALDVTDVDLVRPFWEAVLDYRPHPGVTADRPIATIVDPTRRNPTLWFQTMDTPRRERNRFHLDITVAVEVAQSRLHAALAAGGRLVTDQFAPSWWVLADPEGNEVCICTSAPRDGVDG